MDFSLKQVNGVDIKGVETAFTPLDKPYRTVVKLVMTDDTILFGCVFEDDCTFTAPSPQSVTAHQNTHAGSWGRVRRWVAAADWTVAELMEAAINAQAETNRLIRSLSSVRRSRDEWRVEALNGRTKVVRRDEQIAELKTRIEFLQNQISAQARAFRSNPVASQVGASTDRVRDLENLVNALAAQVNGLVQSNAAE